MTTFFMLGKYSSEGASNISSDRTQRVMSAVKSCGGEIKDIYALLGEKDLAIIADFPNVESAMKASLSVGRMTGISFTTSPALTVQQFDEVAAAVK